jgi:hypothetical protein
MGIHLPDGVRAALRDEGISEDEMLLMTGDELHEAIGGQFTYELVVALAGQRLAVAHYPGRGGRIPQDDLVERNLDILKLRIVDGLTYSAIGREVGLSASRVPQILHVYYGVDIKPVLPVKTLTIPSDALDVARDALLELLTGRIEDMATTIRGPKFPAAMSAFDQVRCLLNDIGWTPPDPETTVQLYVGRDRGAVLAEALRGSLATHRHLADTHDVAQRERAERAATAVELLLAMVGRTDAT